MLEFKYDRYDIALIIMGVITLGLVVALAVYDGKCSFDTLIEEAPETLVRPEIDNFVDRESFVRASAQYEAFENWATREDGTPCKL